MRFTVFEFRGSLDVLYLVERAHRDTTATTYVRGPQPK